jgi:DNA-binding response OmpR family regulator
MKRVLVVEDNVDLAFGLRNNLEIEGYHVDVAEDGEEALRRVFADEPDLVILDLMLPRLSGFHVLRRLRESGSRVPTLVLTARGEETDKVRGLKLGADDYVTKPFSLLELLARVEALLRRTGEGARAPSTEPVRFGRVEFDRATRCVRVDGAEVILTPKEFDLLVELWNACGAVVPRERILQRVWGYPSTVLTRTIDTHVAELRRKIERDPSQPEHILTVRSIGYRLVR